MLRRLLIHVTALITLSITIAQAQLPDSTIVARVGSKVVTAGEISRRLELMPWPDKEQVALHDSVKSDALRSLVAEKLLAQEAVELGIGDNGYATGLLHSMKQAFARDQLYREVTRSSAELPPQELARGYERYGTIVRAIGYDFADEQSAKAFAAFCKSPSLTDSALRVASRLALEITDTLAVKFGDMYPSLEDAMFGCVPPGFTDAIFSPNEGWAVFHVLDSSPDPAIATQSQPEKDATIAKKVRGRLERLRGTAFVKKFLQGTPMSIDSSLFRILATAVTKIVLADSSARVHRLCNDIGMLQRQLAQYLDRPFATRKNEQWTLDDVLETLRFFPTVFPRNHARRVIAFALNQMIMQGVETEALTSEAERRGLQNRKEVKEDLAVWEDALRGRANADRLTLPSQTPNGDTARAKTPRQPNVLRLHIAELARKYGVQLFPETLRQLEISRFSMVTRRYIGFGGAMLAYPMIVPDEQWITWKVQPEVAP